MLFQQLQVQQLVGTAVTLLPATQM